MEKPASPSNGVRAVEPRLQYHCRSDGPERTPMPLSALEGLCVLVADEEAPARQRIIDLLRRNSQLAAILEASDGLSTVEIIQDRRPDLVFLDVQMPELTGLEVIAEVGAG